MKPWMYWLAPVVVLACRTSAVADILELKNGTILDGKYLAMYDKLTDEQARQLATEAFSLEEKRTALKRKYFPQFAQVITARKAVRFFQIENQLNAAVDLQLAAALPLIK